MDHTNKHLYRVITALIAVIAALIAVVVIFAILDITPPTSTPPSHTTTAEIIPKVLAHSAHSPDVIKHTENATKPDPELQALYNEMKRRGLLQNNPELARKYPKLTEVIKMCNEARAQGLIFDPVQGGLVQPTTDSPHAAKANHLTSEPDPYSLDQHPASLKDILNELDRRGELAKHPDLKSKLNELTTRGKIKLLTPESATPGYTQNPESLLQTEISMKTQPELQAMVNEIYARHGYRFHKASLLALFSSKPWYHPDTNLMTAVEARFSPTEVANIRLIHQQEMTISLPRPVITRPYLESQTKP